MSLGHSIRKEIYYCNIIDALEHCMRNIRLRFNNSGQRLGAANKLLAWKLIISELHECSIS